MPNPIARGATRLPMRPKPTMSRSRPARSSGFIETRARSNRFARTAASFSRAFFASASSMNIACSATETELASGVMVTGIERSAAAAMSTAS